MIKFDIAELLIKDGKKGLQIKYDGLPPISAKRFTRKAVANKTSVPFYSYDTNGRMTSNLVWQPQGMDGFNIRIQADLMVDETSGYDPITPWVAKVKSNDILYVKSTIVDKYCRQDANLSGITYMSNGTYWYVDSILVRAKRGVPHMAEMELNLIRLWSDGL